MRRNSFLPRWVCGAVLVLAIGCQRRPLLFTNGTSRGGRLDGVYVIRNSQPIAVGDQAGGNTSGALPDEQLVTAEGKPLGGAAIPVVLTGLLPNLPPNDGSVDGGISDGAAADLASGEGGTASDGGGPIDAGTDDAHVSDAAEPDMGVPVVHDPGQGPVFGTVTPAITLESWLAASVEIRLTPIDRDRYEFRLIGKKLVPNGLYSVWLMYIVSAPTALLYAVAPIGGLPTSFVADEEGNGDFSRLISNRYVEVSNSIPSAIQLGGTGLPPVVTPETSLIVTLNYHSTGQTNGNASFEAPALSGSERAIPAGLIGIAGHVGVDVHPQISTIPMPAVPHADP